MTRKTRSNDIETRLKDAKRSYDLNEILIEAYENQIKKGEEIDTKDLKDLQKLNITLRKQINDMEKDIQNGLIKTAEDENPFSR